MRCARLFMLMLRDVLAHAAGLILLMLLISAILHMTLRFIDAIAAIDAAIIDDMHYF